MGIYSYPGSDSLGGTDIMQSRDENRLSGPNNESDPGCHIPGAKAWNICTLR
jgi:hypothetical protein